MEGKVIKEESASVGSSPCSPAPPAPQHSAACPASTSTTSTSTSNNANPSLPATPNSLPSGKENRRVGSPLNTSEILTRSRSKVLTKENCHHSHHRMSESPKGPGSLVGGLSGGQEGSGMPGVKSLSSHHSHSHSHSHGGSQGFGGHPFPSPHSTTSLATSGIGNGSGLGGRTPSPSSANNTSSTNNLGNSSSSSSTGRTPSSSNNSATSVSASNRSDGMGHGGSGNGRYVVKIKRFLGTLLHFGCDISLEVGDRVRNLVFNLVSGHLSIEEFHHSLQEVTSFPLRPFVLPFLRAHLPLLQREISHLARISKQSPLSFIRSHEQVIIESGSSPGEPCDIFHSEAADMALSGKRKSSESFYENGETGDSAYTSTPKRHHHGTLFSPFSSLVAGSGGASSVSAATAAELREYYTSGYPLLTSAASAHHNHSHLHDSATSTNSATTNSSTNGGMTPKGAEDEWKNIHVMLNCILQMVEKTKRALSILQNRTFHNEVESSGTSSSSSSAAASWLRRPAYSAMDNSDDFKRQAGEMMAQALRATEDRVAEVKRRAEEAVQEVKRQALVELQRAVAAAETRACEAVASERARLERAFMRTPAESMMLGAPVDPETCWNCGRKAHETCSGCNMARYCSSFCQHKDWEHHHTVCGRNSSSGDRERERERSSVPNNSESKNIHVQENSNSSPINVSHPSPDNRSSGSNN